MFTKKEDKICQLLGWLACHVDEDCPAEYRTEHFSNALNDAVEFLEESGWYKFNENRNNAQATSVKQLAFDFGE